MAVVGWLLGVGCGGLSPAPASNPSVIRWAEQEIPEAPWARSSVAIEELLPRQPKPSGSLATQETSINREPVTIGFSVPNPLVGIWPAMAFINVSVAGASVS